MIKEQYWENRAKKYSSFEWAKDPEYIELFLGSMKFYPEDIILDAGIGTGLIAEALSPSVKMIVGVDSSFAMLNQCNRDGNILLMNEDLRDLSFMEESFDKVIARNVFHHITENLKKALEECYRVLKMRGQILIGERVPPMDEVKEEYEQIFELKDVRNVFTAWDLKELMIISGFIISGSSYYTLKNFSVRNWLSKSDLPEEVQEKIFNLHVNGSEDLKRAYNMRIVGDDCLIDIRNVIITGEKR